MEPTISASVTASTSRTKRIAICNRIELIGELSLVTLDASADTRGNPREPFHLESLYS